MTDIAIVLDPGELRGDWMLLGNDLATGNDLQTAVLVSLLTETGWWADAFEDVSIGCDLLTLRRSKHTQQTLLKARDFCRQALAWLVTDGVARAVNVQTEWQPGSRLVIGIEVVKMSGPNERFSWVWSDF